MKILSQLRNVEYLEADSNYTIVHLKNGRKKIFAKTLRYFETKVFTEGYLRIHAKYLVKESAIRSFQKKHNQITLDNKTILPISRRRMYGVYQALLDS